MWCPVPPLVYAGCRTTTCVATTGGTQRKEALTPPWGPSTCPMYTLNHGHPNPDPDCPGSLPPPGGGGGGQNTAC